METTYIYNNLLRKWRSTGYVGKTFCNYETYAKKVAWAVANNITKNKNKKSCLINHSICGGTEPSTDTVIYEQLRLFSI